MSPSRLLPPDALLSSWLIVKLSHQLCCPPLFVAVADHLPPPNALLLHRRCLHCHTAANFINAPPFPSSLLRRFCLLCRAAVAFIIAPLLIVAPPLPSSSRRHSLPHRAAGSAFVNALPLPSSSRRRSLRRRATVSAFVVATPLPSLSRRRCLHRHTTVSAFVVGPPVLPSSSRRRSLHRCAAGSAFVVAPPLPSLSRKRCLPCSAAALFIVVPPLPSSSPPLIVAWFCLRRRTAAAFLVAPSYDGTMVGIRWRRFGSNDGVAMMGGASRRMRQYGISQYFSHNTLTYHTILCSILLTILYCFLL